MEPRTEAMLRTERDLLVALLRDAPRGRPEIQRRLAQVTAELLSIEINRPPRPVPEHPEVEGHELKHWQK